jgi:hypothetical protein
MANKAVNADTQGRPLRRSATSVPPLGRRLPLRYVSFQSVCGFQAEVQ